MHLYFVCAVFQRIFFGDHRTWQLLWLSQWYKLCT
uniref:Pco061446a n=1 Tax=Arundo donax TaxID=35708 RepID=A0A0A9E7I2_ARUDO